MARMWCEKSGDWNEGKYAEKVAVSGALIAVSTSRRGHGMVLARRGMLVLLRMRDEREHAGLFDPIAAFLLGLIERLIRHLD
jgi:hypothetical protein